MQQGQDETEPSREGRFPPNTPRGGIREGLLEEVSPTPTPAGV